MRTEQMRVFMQKFDEMKPLEVELQAAEAAFESDPSNPKLYARVQDARAAVTIAAARLMWEDPSIRHAVAEKARKHLQQYIDTLEDALLSQRRVEQTLKSLSSAMVGVMAMAHFDSPEGGTSRGRGGPSIDPPPGSGIPRIQRPPSGTGSAAATPADAD